MHRRLCCSWSRIGRAECPWQQTELHRLPIIFSDPGPGPCGGLHGGGAGQTSPLRCHSLDRHSGWPQQQNHCWTGNGQSRLQGALEKVGEGEGVWRMGIWWGGVFRCVCIICVYIYIWLGGGGCSLRCMRLCGWRVFRMLCIFGGGGGFFCYVYLVVGGVL